MTYDFEREQGIEESLEAQELANAKYPDNCQLCHGAKGGVRGNENIVDGIVMCDYCTVEYRERCCEGR